MKRNFWMAVVMVVSLMICFEVQAQDLKTDSLEFIFTMPETTDQKKLDISYELCWEFQESDIEKSIYYARQGIRFANKLNEKVMAGGFYRNIGVSQYHMARYDSAMAYFNKAIEISEKENSDGLKAKTYGAIANMYIMQGYDQLGIDYFLKALPIFEKEGSRNHMHTVYMNIGELYLWKANYTEAEKYFDKCEAIAVELNDSIIAAKTYVSQSAVLANKDDTERALTLANEAYRIFYNANYKTWESTALRQIADIYSILKDDDKVIEFVLKALDVDIEMNMLSDIANSYLMLSDAYLSKGMHEESNRAAFKAIEADPEFVHNNISVYRNIVQNHIQMGNQSEAQEYFEKYDNEVTSRSEKNYQIGISELEIKYETEKKELKISALEKEKELYRWLGFAGGAIVLLLVAFLIVRQHLVRQKMARLEQEKQLTATQSVLDGETAERTRLARDLHDGLGGMLSVVKLNLSTMKQGVLIENEDVSRFDAALKMLDDSIGELRRVAHNMMPDSLSRYGLKAALTDFCNSVVGAEFHYFGSGDRLDPKLEVMIYRTVHELVNNAIKHAGATQIIIQIVQEANRISITVQDDGCGFEANAPTSGTGLNNVHNRVGSYNGQMEIFSKPGEGTEINIHFKLPE